MFIRDLITEQSTQFNVHCSSKKRFLEFISNSIADARPSLNAADIYEKLLAREKLGSTGIGEGIAVPHCRLDVSDTPPIITLTQLNTAIDFDAADNQPVDIIFTLLVPENETTAHLEILKEIATLCQQDSLRSALRNAKSNSSLYNAIIQYSNNS